MNVPNTPAVRLSGVTIAFPTARGGMFRAVENAIAAAKVDVTKGYDNSFAEAVK